MKDYVDAPIFLHFLNRELTEAEMVDLKDEQALRYIYVSQLITSGYIYVGNAIVWEATMKYHLSVQLLCKLENVALAFFPGGDRTLESFLEKRRKLYHHDKKKYSIYFTDKEKNMPWPSHVKIMHGDTTKKLTMGFYQLIENDDPYGFGKLLHGKEKNTIAKQLRYREKNSLAVTFKLFSKCHISVQTKQILKRYINCMYNLRYLKEYGGYYMTGVPGLGYYDSYQSSGIYYDFQYLNSIFYKLNLIPDIKTSSVDDLFLRLCLLKSNSLYRRFLKEVKIFATICNHLFHKEKILFENILSLLGNGGKNGNIEDKLVLLWRVNHNLIQKYPEIKERNEFMEDDWKRILILSASPLEYRILRQTARKYGFHFIDKNAKNEEFSYAECLDVEDSKLYLARTAVGPMNSSSTIQGLQEEINPDYIVMGGICIGLVRDKQKLGKLLISRQIQIYDSYKLTDKGKILRGDVITSNRYLYDKFLLESFEYDTSDVDEGLIVSANVLSNCEEYVKQIKEERPDAIGFEMEGGGLIHAARIFQDKWILIKAISDWGYRKDDDFQEKAAEMSYRFIFDTIKKRIMRRI